MKKTVSAFLMIYVASAFGALESALPPYLSKDPDNTIRLKLYLLPPDMRKSLSNDLRKIAELKRNNLSNFFLPTNSVHKPIKIIFDKPPVSPDIKLCYKDQSQGNTVLATFSETNATGQLTTYSVHPCIITNVHKISDYEWGIFIHVSNEIYTRQF